jgi:hypothetical protein
MGNVLGERPKEVVAKEAKREQQKAGVRPERERWRTSVTMSKGPNDISRTKQHVAVLPRSTIPRLEACTRLKPGSVRLSEVHDGIMGSGPCSSLSQHCWSMRNYLACPKQLEKGGGLIKSRARIIPHTWGTTRVSTYAWKKDGSKGHGITLPILLNPQGVSGVLRNRMFKGFVCRKTKYCEA